MYHNRIQPKNQQINGNNEMKRTTTHPTTTYNVGNATNRINNEQRTSNNTRTTTTMNMYNNGKNGRSQSNVPEYNTVTASQQEQMKRITVEQEYNQTSVINIKYTRMKMQQWNENNQHVATINREQQQQHNNVPNNQQ